ncbi:MAG: hypothetical protein IJS61_05770 [Firmicutes bacterium]|nr:hypothetical protein [Bacillota bacterium]
MIVFSNIEERAKLYLYLRDKIKTQGLTFEKFMDCNPKNFYTEEEVDIIKSIFDFFAEKGERFTSDVEPSDIFTGWKNEITVKEAKKDMYM